MIINERNFIKKREKEKGRGERKLPSFRFSGWYGGWGGTHSHYFAKYVKVSIPQLLRVYNVVVPWMPLIPHHEMACCLQVHHMGHCF
jgi:hypothetical protein